MRGREVIEMEEKREANSPFWIWIVVIGISAIIVVSLIMSLK